VDRLAREQEAAGTRVFVVEAPLLVEAGWQSYFDQVWLVRARPQTLRRRLKARGLSAADIEARLAAATDAEAAAAHAHVIIDNDADLPSLQRAIDEAWNANVEG
jgi:dephospho-CoA kinase